MAEGGANARLKEAEPPAGTDSGKANPEEVNPVPETEACVTLSVAVPGFLMVSVWELVTPTVTLPKLTLEGMTEICGCTAVPLRDIASGELVALLTTLMLPAAAPAVVGAKFAVSGRVWPAASVTAPGNPVTLKPEPVTAICETLRLPVPVFVRVNGCEAELPTSELPKFKLDALSESRKVCGGAVFEGVPMPETPTEIGDPPLWPGVMTIVPLNVSAESGLKSTCMDALALGFRLIGSAEAMTTNSGRLLATC